MSGRDLFAAPDPNSEGPILRRLLYVLLIGAAAARASAAQETPEAAAQAFGDAIKAQEWATAARLMHPDALKQLRDLFGPLLESPAGDQVRSKLFSANSPAEFASTPDTVLFARFLEGAMTQEPGLTDAMKTATMTSLGHVQGAGDTVFVVTRTIMTVQGVTIRQFEVLPFLRQNGHWRGLLKADFTNMAAMLQRAFGSKPS